MHRSVLTKCCPAAKGRGKKPKDSSMSSSNMNKSTLTKVISSSSCLSTVSKGGKMQTHAGVHAQTHSLLPLIFLGADCAPSDQSTYILEFSLFVSYVTVHTLVKWQTTLSLCVQNFLTCSVQHEGGDTVLEDDRDCLEKVRWVCVCVSAFEASSVSSHLSFVGIWRFFAFVLLKISFGHLVFLCVEFCLFCGLVGVSLGLLVLLLVCL